MDQNDQVGLEESLNLILLQIADLQDRIWDRLEVLDKKGRLEPMLEEHVRRVMRSVSLWVDECTRATESPPILLRRMQVQLERLKRLESFIGKTMLNDLY